MSRGDRCGSAASAGASGSCADDYGISPAVNAAIRDLVARGRLNATSVMVAAPSFDAPKRPRSCRSMPLRRGSRSACTSRSPAPFRPLARRFRADARRRVSAARQAMLARALARPPRPRSAGGRDRRAARGVRQRLRPRAGFHRRPSARAAVCRQCAMRCSAVVQEAAPQAWVRQCGERAAAAALRRSARGCCSTG